MLKTYSLHLVDSLRNEAQQTLTKESVIDQFTQLIESVDTTTLEFISLHLSLLQSYMPATQVADE